MHFQSSTVRGQAGLRNGFTLPELLVCLAIVGIMIGLALPALQKARTVSYRTDCANNLRQIGAAYHVFLDEHRGKTSAFKGDENWVKVLRPYVEGRDRAFNCLADSQIPETQRSIPETPSSSVPGNSLASGPKVSGLVPRPPLQGKGQGSSTGFGADWTDALILVAPQADGSIKLMAFSKNADYTPESKDQPGAGFEEKNVPQANESATGAAGKSSYGISSMAEHFSPSGDGDKVLAVEYKKLVVNVFGPSAPDFWPTDSAARHQGMLNVLYKGGSVQTMMQFDLDPRVSANYLLHWLPESR